jgi:hypothetical protein
MNLFKASSGNLHNRDATRTSNAAASFGNWEGIVRTTVKNIVESDDFQEHFFRTTVQPKLKKMFAEWERRMSKSETRE